MLPATLRPHYVGHSVLPLGRRHNGTHDNRHEIRAHAQITYIGKGTMYIFGYTVGN